MGKVYRSFQGREVDMEKLMSSNELMPAIGNAKVNARGDELRPGGQIIKKREQIVAEYYEKEKKSNPDDVQPIKTKKDKKPKIESTIQDNDLFVKQRGNNESKRQNSSLEE